MTQLVVNLRDLDRNQSTIAGGKGANLGELSRIDGVRVPPGFVVTTAATELSAALVVAITAAVGTGAYAVRSSATAEDLPTASFAGQQDSYLNVVGADAVMQHVERCWDSLFTDRAVAYRDHHGIDHRTVRMAVVVQEMVVPEVSGVLFTADPVTGNRTVTAVEAVPGLGEALVSGLADPDSYTIRDGRVDGTSSLLTEEQVLRLAALGRRIEAHFGSPQDIEWCLAGDEFSIVQSRPITTLFPVPVAGDQNRHVYVSVGHQQMMTDAMKPLGYSMWQLTAMAPMHQAGGRLFVDVAARLADPAIRAGLLDVMGKGDPVIRDALETVLERGDFGPPAPATARPATAPVPDPEPGIVAELIARSEQSVEALRRAIAGRSGTALFDFLLEAFQEHKRMLADPLSIQAIMAGMGATWWLNDRLAEWLGEKNAADTLTLSAPGNITSEMGLELLDVADVIRRHPGVADFLETAGDDFLDHLPAEVRDAIGTYLDRYGMRCVAEIDITRPRWIERPGTLLPVILDNVRNLPPGEARRRFERGERTAAAKAEEILVRLRALPDGESKAAETKQMIDRLRTFIGYREYPKYAIVSRYRHYKNALLAEASRLPLADREDVFYLTFQEFHDAVRVGKVDEQLIRSRKDEFRWFQTLSTPRVLTSDGETVNGSYRRDDVPAGALIGLAVSAGTVEGRARVVRDMADADFAPGDILVTPFTDPSWTPALVTVAGLVTEVGGQMTHGAVIAREYGLPAVVGVDGATRRIADGDRIRVHGTDGYVEILIRE
ncbi:rifamycin-inactivating phosphotransferase [Actinoplanes derwentensis]|uniref:Pyruvate, water dikinase n=1 Tax=Actinoplanes derwentensis TaxID=113562 RepID=A0A1H1YHT5_9ACTN|nr:rifamycin-inactivating phosphotransferase [Actinoplanes derwentensis]GID81145.1 putative phosphoenolpyruvate synthase [Actinoplanes derwentensis]SDT20829.1 pyruvate, water dikinase [Actinoplanes derwentensis]